jgi:hypothetical protein
VVALSRPLGVTMPDADVVEAAAAAEREAAEAEALCQAVEERVLDGGPEATKGEIGHLGLARFARLRAEAANRRAERAREAERQRQLAALRKEVDAYAEDSGTGLAGLLEEVERAAAAFVEAVADREAKLAGWHARMRALGVPTHDAPVSPPEAHGRLGYDGAIRVISGMRRLVDVDAGRWLGVALSQAARAAAGGEALELTAGDGRRVHVATLGIGWRQPERADAYAPVRELDTPHPEPSPQHFYRGRGGAVIARDEPYPAEEVARLELEPITRMEAWGA